MIQKSLFSLLVLASLVSCSTSKTKLSETAKSVRILKSKKASGCSVMDSVKGVNEKGQQELAKNHARNLAAKIGGNAIYIDKIVPNGYDVEVFATVYECGE